jgi:hypothetical protein
MARVEHKDRPVMGSGEGPVMSDTKAVQVSDADEMSFLVGAFRITLSENDLKVFDLHRAQVNSFRTNIDKGEI